MSEAHYKQMLLNCALADNEIRKKSEEALQEFKRSNPQKFLEFLVSQMVCKDLSPECKLLCGILFKNTLNMKEQQFAMLWMSIPSQTRTGIKNSILANLATEIKDIRKATAQAISSIAVIELGRNEWFEIIPNLITNSLNKVLHIRYASLETLSYIFEELSTNIFSQDIINGLLGSIIENLSLAEDFCISFALKALQNVLKFCLPNFQNNEQKGAIIKAIIAHTKSQKDTIRFYSFQCLLEIIRKFYDNIADVFYLIAQASSINLTSEKEPSILQISAEIWGSLADDELLKIKEKKTQVYGLIASSYANIIDTFLNLILQNPNEEADGSNIGVQIGSMLNIMHQIVPTNLLEPVVEFVKKNFSNANVNNQVASLVALMSLMEIPDQNTINHYLTMYFDQILEKVRHKNPLVRENAVWAIAKICEKPKELVGNDNNLNFIILAFQYALSDNCKQVINQALTGLRFISITYSTIDRLEDNILLKYIPPMLQNLYNKISNLIISNEKEHLEILFGAFNCMQAIIQSCNHKTPELTSYYEFFLNDVITKLSSWFQNPASVKIDVVSHFYGVMYSIIGKQQNEYKAETIDRTINLVVGASQVLQKPLDEGIKVISAICFCLQEKMVEYADKVWEMILKGIKEKLDYTLCSESIMCFGDILRCVKHKYKDKAKDILPYLYELFKDPYLDLNIKLASFSTLGDISFHLYQVSLERFDESFSYIKNACESSLLVIQNDEETIPSLNRLREVLFQVFTSIIFGLKEANKTDLLNPYLPFIIEYLKSVLTNDLTRKDLFPIIGTLVYDLGSVYRGTVKTALEDPLLIKLKDHLMNEDPKVGELMSKMYNDLK